MHTVWAQLWPEASTSRANQLCSVENHIRLEQCDDRFQEGRSSGRAGKVRTSALRRKQAHRDQKIPAQSLIRYPISAMGG